MCCPSTQIARAGRATARREKVIQAARTAFKANGFHATGIAQIAHASGVAVGQIYRDFANKEAIVAEIVTRDLEEFLSEGGLCEAGAKGDAAAVHDWITRFVTCADPEGGRLVAEIMAEASRNQRIAEIVRTLHDGMRGKLTAALRVLAGPAAPSERIEQVAEMIHTVAAGVFQRRLTAVDQPSDAAIDGLMHCIDATIEELRAAP